MQHTYAVFYQSLTGKKTQSLVAEINFSPTKVVSAGEIGRLNAVLKEQHPEAKEINITGMMYLRSHQD